MSKKILVIRKFDGFSRILAENDFAIINLPLIEPSAIDDLSDFDAKLADIKIYDGIFITSKNAARILGEKLREKNISYNRKVYVLGKSSFEILRNESLNLVFDELANTARQMLENIGLTDLKDKYFLFIRGEKSLRTVPEFLSKLAKVDEAIVYETRKIIVDTDKIKLVREKIENNNIAVACFFSPSGVESFIEQFGAEILHQTIIATIGTTTASFFERQNLRVGFIASKSNAEDFAVELINFLQMIEIKENQNIGTVIVDKYEVEGFIDDSKTCPKCSQNQIYYDDYDSFFCPHCNIWLDSVCSDSTCEFCRSRPEKSLN